ncbi:hypothetical protein Q8F55_006304 [Vanrija albida]|uniref:Pinin/SDK/MemA protein domain-containing protein n=1 Tax=Vanrija albida TaxID=181172 RepID=A0ABR3PX14_9TREE
MDDERPQSPEAAPAPPHAESSKSASPRRPSKSASPRRTDGAEPDPAPKRARTDRKAEDKTRSRRMFGNLLGTLQKFKDDDGRSRGSAAAQRREQTSARIAERLRSETSKLHEIAEAERELKALRVGAESAAYVLKHKEIALAAQGASLRTAARYLATTAGAGTPVFEATLIAAAPLPLARGPARIERAKALYFLPKVLLPHQEERLRAQAADAERLESEAEAALRAEKDEARAAAAASRERIAELGDKLHALKDKRKAEEGEGEAAPPREVREDRHEREPELGFEIDTAPAGNADEMEVEY